MDYQANGFEKFYNSTFGVPQQVLMRILRVMQDPNVDLLDEEGLLDQSLIPILGLFDEERKDVGTEEMVQIANRALGTKMNKKSLGAQLGVGILTDPTTFMTGGLSAIGRAGTTAQKALRVGDMPKLLSEAGISVRELAEGNQKLSTDTFLSYLKKSRENLSLTTKEHSALKKAELAVEGVKGDHKNIGDLLSKSSEQQLTFGLPILHRWGAGIKVTDQHKYWFGFMGSAVGKSRAGKTLGAITRPLADVPLIGTGLKNISGLAAGLKTGRLPLTQMVSESKLKGDELESTVNTLSPTGKIIYQKVKDFKPKDLLEKMGEQVKKDTKRYKGKLTPDQIQKRAIIQALNKNTAKVPADPEVIDETYQRLVSTMLDLPDNVPAPVLDKVSLMEGLTHFNKRFGEAEEKFLGSFVNLEKDTSRALAVKKFRKVGKAGFAAGTAMSRLWGKVFKQGADYKILDESSKALIKYNALGTESVNQIARDAAVLLRKDAEKLGVEPEVLDSLVLHLAEGQPMMEEIYAHLDQINNAISAGEKLGGAERALSNFIVRLTGLIDSTGVQARGGKANKYWDKIVNFMQDAFGSGVRNPASVVFKADWGGQRAYTKAIEARESIQGIAENKISLGSGKHKGRFLGTLEDTELDDVIEELKIGKTQPTTDDIHQFILDNPVYGKVLSDHNLEPKELLRLLDHDAIKNFTGDLTSETFEIGNFSTKTGKRIVPMVSSGGKRKKITRDQFIALRQLREQVEQGTLKLKPDDAFDVSKLSAQEQILYGQVDKIKQLRNAGEEEIRVAVGAESVPLPGRSAVDVSAVDELGEEIELNDFGRAVGRLASIQRELKRCLDEGVGISPTLTQELKGALNHIHGTWEDAIRTTFGKNTEFLDYMRDIQKASLVEAVRAGSHTLSSPIAYVARILTRSQTRALSGVLRSQGFEDIAKAYLPSLGSSFARDVDQMDIEQLNALYQAVKTGTIKESKAAKKFTDLVEEIADEAGIDVNEKFSQSMFHSVIARQSQAVTGQGNRKYLEQALATAQTQGVGIGGKVIGFATATDDQVIKHIPKPGQTQRGAVEDKFKLSETAEAGRGSIGLVIEGSDGANHIVPLSLIDGTQRVGVTYGDRIDNLADAMSARATRGDFTHQDRFGISNLDPTGKSMNWEKLEALQGQQVFIGEEAAARGMHNAMANMWQNSNQLAVAYDTAQYMVKRWQTVFRPAFHVSNFMSMFSQMATIGTRPINQIAGLADALHFLGTNTKMAAAYNRFKVQTAASTNQKVSGFLTENTRGFGMNFLNVIRKAGLEEILEKSPEQIMKEFPHLNQEDMFFKVGTQKYSMFELLEAWREGNMFSTFAVEGFRGGTGVSQTALRTRAIANKGKGGQALLKAEKVRDELTESSEVTVRLAAFFGQLRQGKTLSEAVENVKLATVDYSDLTAVERTYAKRAFAYYTFPRKFLPVAANYFAEHPARMATAAKLISQEGLFREQRGRLRFDFNEDIGSIDATRVMPHLEALKVLETVGETFLDTGSYLSENAARSLRAEDLNQRTPEVVTFGSIPMAGFAAFDGNERTSAMKEIVNAFWFTKFIWEGDNPTEEDSELEKIKKLIVPIAERDPEEEREMLKRRFRLSKSTIQDKLKMAIQEGDTEEANEYRKELNLLSALFRDEVLSTTQKKGIEKIRKDFLQ